LVFETTPDAIVLLATEASATSTHTSSIPPGLMAGEFETSWAILTKDLRAARYFDNASAALAHYRQTSGGISRGQHSQILSALGRLETGADKGTPNPAPAGQVANRRRTIVGA
jgi:hypothetical protein